MEKHVREAAKSENSRAPVPMCDRLGASLLYYKDENPSLSDWVFGSLRTGRPFHRTALGADHLLPALRRMAAEFRKELPNGIPEGTGFHAFRHAYNALIAQVGTDDPNKVKEVQIKLLRQGDKRTNDRYGKSAPPLRQRARQAHINVSELAMGEAISQADTKSGPNLDQTRRSTVRRLVPLVGAGDRDRTGDIQLGKLTFYH